MDQARLHHDREDHARGDKLKGTTRTEETRIERQVQCTYGTRVQREQDRGDK